MEKKVCKKCNEEKLLSEFGMNNRLKSGVSNVCLECRRIETKIFYDKNKEKELERNREKSKNFRLNNREKTLILLREWKNKNKNHINEYAKKYYHNKKEQDNLFIFSKRVRGVVLSSFRRACNGRYVKGSKTEKILGCNFFEFMNYIKNLFKEGMSFDNHGEWELDHKIPVSSANSEEEIIKLNHYTNFQPLWKLENRLKSNKIIYGN
jgi:RecG-like helicase